ncbi:MAG: hypothetical protein AAF542_12085 [Pseudomonadota bacterium]
MLHSYKSLITAGSLSLILASGTALAENQGSGQAKAQVVKPDGVFNSFGIYLNNLAEYIEKLIEGNPEIQAKIAEANAKADEQKTQVPPTVTRPAAQGPATRFQSPQSNSRRPIVARRPAVNTPVAGRPALNTPVAARPAVNTPAAARPAVNTPAAARPAVNTPVATLTTASTPSTQWNNWFQSPRRWWQTQINNQPKVSQQPTVAKQPAPARPALPSQEDEPKTVVNAPSRAAPTPVPPTGQVPQNTVAAAPKAAPTPAPKQAPAPAPAPAPTQEPVTTVAAAPTPAPAPRQEPTPAPAPEPEPVTGSASLSWSIPTKRENGDSLALNEIASYEIYVTAENAGTSRTIRVDNRTQTKYTVSPLDSDTYFFSMVTIDSEGMYSELSQVVSKTIN